MPNHNSDIAQRRFQCRHIFTDGHRCGSPSLRHEHFCYYHHTTRRPKQPTHHDPFLNPPNETNFVLPIPEDRRAVQQALGEIMNKLAANALDPRRAGLLLYALQIASANIKPTRTKEAQRDEEDTVEEITVDPVHGTLAPIAEVGENEPLSTVERLIQEFEEMARLENTPPGSPDEEKGLAIQATAAAPRRPRRHPRSRPKCRTQRTLDQEYPRGGVPSTPPQPTPSNPTPVAVLRARLSALSVSFPSAWTRRRGLTSGPRAPR